MAGRSVRCRASSDGPLPAAGVLAIDAYFARHVPTRRREDATTLHARATPGAWAPPEQAVDAEHGRADGHIRVSRPA